MGGTRFPSMRGFTALAVAVIADGLRSLCSRLPEDAKSRDERYRRQKAQREELAFFDYNNERFRLWCAHLGFNPRVLARYIHANHDKPEFRVRIAANAVIPLLLGGDDARDGSHKSLKWKA